MGSLWRTFGLGGAVLPAERAKPTVDPAYKLKIVRFVVSFRAVVGTFGGWRVDHNARAAATFTSRPAGPSLGRNACM